MEFRQFGPYTVELTRVDKPLIGTITKGDLIAYYEYRAPTMLPYMKDHPLMMHRFPDGIAHESFYQKDASHYFPEWIKTVPIEKKDGFYNAVVCQNKATLVYLANQACITPHVWLSRIDNLEVPDRIIFDLDPSDNDFGKVIKVAQEIKLVLDTLKLSSFVMTSGSKGLHIYVPLRRSADFNATKALADGVALQVINNNEHIATRELRKDKRGTNVFIDTLRNQRGATSVAPYAVRALPKGPIATPIYWSDLDDPLLHPQYYTLETIFEQSTKKDPWVTYFTSKQSITKALLSNFLPINTGPR